jgi:3-methylcrotonyl-CoA carboxylase alpha subunit
MKNIEKILIANRGEIACRVIRTAKAMGIKTVSIYSDIDRDALHVQLADEAYLLGPAPAAESYLLGDKIIQIALACNAQAIHPGYGFLSENSQFARACENANLIFIGPPASAIDAMGAKDKAKKIMEQAKVPLVPGYHGEDQSENTLFNAIKEIGYPVLLKATAGGGGKGMRVVESEADFSAAFKSTKREALSSFADDKLLVEKYLTQPRHIEIQVFCDSLGNGVYLFERDCSIQRRHQKVIEEAPAPSFSEELRCQMGETALKAAAAINYVGAGTIEFLLDKDGSFYFMEMNTRLQVEHPVTEYISGQDLVEWQLIVAAGDHLPLRQDELSINGHAIEVRVYAEDPNNDFLPASGILQYLKMPAISSRVRIDSGVQQGDTISSFYDPMISKLIVWGKDRNSAIREMARALDDYHIVGLQTNIGFLQRLVSCPAFESIDLDTHFIERHHHYLFGEASNNDQKGHHSSNEALAIYGAALYIALSHPTQERVSNDTYSPWQTNDGWRLNELSCDKLQLRLAGHGNEIFQLSVEYVEAGYLLQCDDKPAVKARGEYRQHQLSMTLDNSIHQLDVYRIGNKITIFRFGQRCDIEYIPADTGNTHEETSANLKAPMSGRVIEVSVAAGDHVKSGVPLITIEAMKMEHTIYSSAEGTINAVFYSEGDMVEDSAELVDFRPVES